MSRRAELLRGHPVRDGTMNRSPTIAAWVLALAAAGVLGCGSTVTPSRADGAGVAAGVGGASATAAASGTGGDRPCAGCGGDPGCVRTETELAPRSLATLVLIDRSDSMAPVWDELTTQLTDFYGGDTPAGQYAALGFFPPESVLNTCYPDIYDPPEVAFELLPGQAAALQAALAATTPAGTSPTYYAMEGTYQYATAYLAANPDKDVVVVLVSDGQPATCGSGEEASIRGQAGLAAGAAEAGVRTFVVALPSGAVGTLDPVAAAGGTGKAYDLASGAAALGQTMIDIRELCRACSYLLPVIRDPAGVGVYFTPGGGDAQQVPQVAGDAACGEEPGWYYDVAAAPTEIHLCPALCTSVDRAGAVTLVEGCPS
jgi:hypothetical protein